MTIIREKSIAEAVIDLVPNQGSFSKITENHIKSENEKFVFFLFDDLSILKVKKDYTKAFISKSRFLNSVDFEKIKYKKPLFGNKNKTMDLIEKRISLEKGDEIYFSAITINPDKILKFGIERIYLTTDNLHFVKLPSGKTKEIHVKKLKKILSYFNIDLEILKTQLKEKQNKEKRFSNYEDKAEEMLDFLKKED